MCVETSTGLARTSQSGALAILALTLVFGFWEADGGQA
jgi:hypothetical protein